MSTVIQNMLCQCCGDPAAKIMETFEDVCCGPELDHVVPEVFALCEHCGWGYPPFHHHETPDVRLQEV